jgi:hypothetical protein
MRADPGLTSPPRIATWLSLLVLVFMPIATGIGLFVPGFYRDTPWTIPQARGQDLVNLVVAEPLLAAAMFGAWLAGPRAYVSARLLWTGVLSYVLYTYALFSFTAYFNALFLVYVALFAAALFALIDLLVHLDLARVRRAIGPGMPSRPIAGFLAFVGAFFLVAWLAQIVAATLQGMVPESVTLAKTPSNGVFVQDLGVVIPLMFAAAVWLWQRRTWGYVLGAILLVLTDVMALALVAMSLFSAQARLAGALDMLWVFVALALVSIAFTAVFAAHMHVPASRRQTNGPQDGARREGAGREGAQRAPA